MKNKTYSYDEAFDASLKYFDGDELAARVWVNKYAMKDSFGNIYEQSPEDMHNRLANEISRIEQKYQTRCRQVRYSSCLTISDISFRQEAL